MFYVSKALTVHIKSAYNQHISKYQLAHHLPNIRFFGVCRNFADFLNLIPVLRRFRIIRHQRQEALHSTLFINTPLVIRGTDKNKLLAIIKPTQTGINRNKYTFCVLKSLEPKIIQTPAASLSQAKFFKFLSKFLKSHETVPLRNVKEITSGYESAPINNIQNCGGLYLLLHCSLQYYGASLTV